MENNNEVQQVIKMIIDEFKFLEDLGYKSSINFPTSEVFLDHVKVEYNNSEKKRIVSISYTKNILLNDIKRSFNLNIVKLPYQDPRKDYFSQIAFMESIGKELVSSMINDFSNEEVEQILRKISTSLISYSMKIITGEKWEEGYFPSW
ncbi:hypothetical protein [Flavihumibacter sp. UBA7668]|uniref:hypothetical protein n=1 Tax=Flavihumibacter sp. UBA7668 TaxID=1946542 RepID=UPI0025BDFFFE|nr:hypothetical protein [Flavihumibacter sp. UBA7668]